MPTMMVSRDKEVLYGCYFRPMVKKINRYPILMVNYFQQIGNIISKFGEPSF